MQKMKNPPLIVLGVILVAGAIRARAQSPLYEAEQIFPPEPFHNHSASIIETPDGDLLACWFHGKGERTDDTLVISGARKRKGESKWSAPFLMADNKNLPDQNPVLFIDPRKTLWLFWISSMDNLVRSYLLKYRTATDYSADGPPKWNWQDVIFCRPPDLESKFVKSVDQLMADHAEFLEKNPRFKTSLEESRKMASDKLFQRLGWMPRQPPIMISDKRMMLGLYSDVFDCSLAAFTDDWGESWEFSPPMIFPDRGNIQPGFVRKKDGNIAAFMREAGLKHMVRHAESSDGGMTWTEIPTEIPNPGSSVSVAALKTGHWVLVCNDTPAGRHRLTAFLSDDEGKTWKWKRQLEMLPEEGSASYPTVIESADGMIHCVYSYKDKSQFAGSTIKHVRFNEKWVEQEQE